MKKIILTFALVLIASLSLAQYSTADSLYKDYKVCNECFQKDVWHKTGLENYGYVHSPSSQKKQRGNGFFAQQGRTIVYGVTAIVVAALTYSIYNSVTNATNH